MAITNKCYRQLVRPGNVFCTCPSCRAELKFIKRTYSKRARTELKRRDRAELLNYLTKGD